MRTRSCKLAALAALAACTAIAALPQPADAQITRRLRDAARRTADAAKQAAAEEARREVDRMLADVTGEVVADGRFAAVLTPWSGSEGTGRAEYARVAGWASVVGTGGGYQLLLCEESESQPWSATVAVQPEHAARATRPAPGAAAAAPPVPEAREHSLPSPLVRLTIADSRVRVLGDARGTLAFEAVTDELWVGTLRVVLPTVSLPGEANPEEAELGATFRARLLKLGDPHPACAATRQSRE